MNRSDEHVKRMQNFLEQVVSPDAEYPEIVVHEAVEALGNLSHEKTESLLSSGKIHHAANEMVLETCLLAKELLKWRQETNNGETEGLKFTELKFKTNDPAPPYSIYGNAETAAKCTIPYLQDILLKHENLFERYRALFTLRELNTKESMIGIC